MVSVLKDTFKAENVAPGHCTGEPAFAALKQAWPWHFCSVGTEHGDRRATRGGASTRKGRDHYLSQVRPPQRPLRPPSSVDSLCAPKTSNGLIIVYMTGSARVNERPMSACAAGNAVCILGLEHLRQREEGEPEGGCRRGNWKASHRRTTSGEHSRGTRLPGTVTFQAAVMLMLWCVVRALMADAWATSLQRVEFESASERLVSGALIPGAYRANWRSPTATALFPPSSDCTAAPGCMTRQSKGWPMTLSPGAMSSCSSTAMRRVVSITPARQPRLQPSSGAGQMPAGLWSSWPAKPSSIHTVWLRSRR